MRNFGDVADVVLCAGGHANFTQIAKYEWVLIFALFPCAVIKAHRAQPSPRQLEREMTRRFRSFMGQLCDPASTPSTGSDRVKKRRWRVNSSGVHAKNGPSVVVFEACGRANYWAGQLEAMGRYNLGLEVGF